ncbi:hypothetical protein JCM5805K_0483 [Lactococcus lactis subsp. lactis]|uniref:Uncharacterized protein n=1 Tax=Lactococcus lactis subsp. lactis TaxID=1360 RepID=A0A0B8QLF8_LACLL|nr:Small integral membrane protein [Lactococcus lactis subsp. lactis]PCS15381.1 hypothetical protein RU91_GL001182 [Lactococcus lactis subsp. lactis]GAM79376.1 hypothetical protein JCM5805K_0483 [Lactococcus lactis subsp. lactis]
MYLHNRILENDSSLLFLLIGLGIFVGLYLQRTGIIEQLLKKK